MAVVYAARDLKHQRAVAIKVVRPEISAIFGATRFLREIGISASLQHPHVLTLIDSGDADGTLYYVMPLVEGETLRERLAREGRLTVSDSARILRDVLDALSYAHHQGVIHRDIKPENIMLSGQHAFVMDFGIAKAASVATQIDARTSGAATAIGIAIGTPAYMAPEQASGDLSIDARADLYSVATVAYEMLSGQTPFSGNNSQAIFVAQATRSPAPIGELRPDLPEQFARAIDRCLAKDPADRLQTAEAFAAEVEPYLSASGAAAARGIGARPRAKKRALLASAGLLALVVAATAFWFGTGKRARDARWARETGMPKLLALGDAGDWDAAYALARRIDSIIPRDSFFAAMRPRFARRATLRSNPSGATVRWKPYSAPDSAWTLVGSTPVDNLLLPATASSFSDPIWLRFEAPGSRTVDHLWRHDDGTTQLDREGDLPPDMVRVTGGAIDLAFTVGFADEKPIQLGDFLMDRFEVTNEQYKRFVSDGGYRRREFWENPITQGGHAVPWEQAIAGMVDRTGRPGPSTWEGGDYPEGQGKFPVGGVSWYEAAAYARYAGKSLPTLWHWYRAASPIYAASIIPRGNFSGNGARAVGSGQSISEFGTYDMAGNVREWCANASGTDRFILGGGWNDQPYLFTDAFTQPPLDRSQTNGIRLVKYLQTDSMLAHAGEPMHRFVRDYAKEKPASEELLAAYRRIFEYDRGPLDAKLVEKVDESDWTRELVGVNAAYGNERLLIYLFEPKAGRRPYPAIIYYPGSNAIRDVAPQNLQTRIFSFMLKSGRAVIYPVYKGTYQRSDSLYTDVKDRSAFYRDHVVMWTKDLSRSIDYAETRSEMSTDHLAYYGVSWGGELGGLMAAVEPRIKVNVLYSAGLVPEATRPEVDPFNYLSHIHIPTLMLNGKYDFFFPVSTSQEPMFRLLGTPPDQKRHVVEEGSHFVPRTRLIEESLAWLDKYQPVPH
jgi:formylglycine-generating enzyme required for sulfatase activity/dienelactone hydrolase